jgi:hypothetical protein
MSEPSGDEALQSQIRDELTRIGLGDGLNIGGAVTPAQLLSALRATPDGAGAAVFFGKLAALIRPDLLE